MVAELVSLAAERERRYGRRPTAEEHIGALYEWRVIGEQLAPEQLAEAVGCLRGWPVPVERTSAVVLPFVRAQPSRFVAFPTA